MSARVPGPKIPSKKNPQPSSVRFGEETWERIGRVARQTGRTNSYVIERFIEWALEEWEREREHKPKL